MKEWGKRKKINRNWRRTKEERERKNDRGKKELKKKALEAIEKLRKKER